MRKYSDNDLNHFDTMIYVKPPRRAVGNNKTYWQSFEYMFILPKGNSTTINLIYDRANKESRKGDEGTKRLSNGSMLNLSAQPVKVRLSNPVLKRNRMFIWTCKFDNYHLENCR